MYRKTKKQRQRWWNSLTPIEQDSYVKSVMVRKAEMRRKADDLAMEETKPKNCNLCIHYKTSNCEGGRPRGCPDYYNTRTKLKTKKMRVIKLKKGELKAIPA